jgi:hypothetical protein
MRPLLRAAARLYPRAWRARYGEEFDALIDDLTPRWRDVLNIVFGALIVQISRPAALPVAIALGGAILGAAVSLAMPPVYASSARVLVLMPGRPSDDSERALPIREAVEAVLQEAAVDRRVFTVTSLRGKPGRTVPVVDVSASGGSASAAKDAAEKAVGAIIKANLVASERHAQNTGVQFRVLEVPHLPMTSHRDWTRNSAIGGTLGFGVGGIVVLVAYRRRHARAVQPTEGR